MCFIIILDTGRGVGDGGGGVQLFENHALNCLPTSNGRYRLFD